MAKAPNSAPKKNEKIGRAVAPADASEASDAEELKHPDDAKSDALDVKDDELDEAPEAPRVARPAPVDQSNAGGKRFYAGTKQVDHDLFKLGVAFMIRNHALATEIPDYRKSEHVHWFHTVDSNGRAQETSSAVGGHFHTIKPTGRVKDGVPELSVSEPMVHVFKKVKGQKVRVAVRLAELDPDADDRHKHPLIYQRSEKIQLRQMNSEMANLESAVAQREVRSGIPGIHGG